MDSDDIRPPTFFSLPPKSRFIFHTSDRGQRARSSFLAADRCRLFSFSRAIPAGRERQGGRVQGCIASLFFSRFLSFLAFARDNALSMQARDVVYLLFVFLSFFLSVFPAGHRKPIYLGFIWSILLLVSQLDFLLDYSLLHC